MSNTAFALAGLSAFCFGSGAIFDKLTVSHLPPTTAYMLRFYLLIPAVFPLLILGWHDHKAAMVGSPRIVAFYILGSVVLYTLGMFIFYHAVSRAQVSKVVPISSIYPMITFVLSMMILSEPFSWSKLGGTLLIIAGLGVLTKW